MSRTNAVLKSLVAFCFFLWFIFGLHGYFSDFEENKCQMTYMYEYPQYLVSIILILNLSLFNTNTNLFDDNFRKLISDLNSKLLFLAITFLFMERVKEPTSITKDYSMEYLYSSYQGMQDLINKVIM